MGKGASHRQYSTWVLTTAVTPPEMEYEGCEGEEDLDNNTGRSAPPHCAEPLAQPLILTFHA